MRQQRLRHRDNRTDTMLPDFRRDHNKSQGLYPNECTPQATDCNLVTYTDANCQNRYRSNFAGLGTV